MEADLWISGNSITATMKDHTLHKYNLQGQLIADFLISNVEGMMYDTDEIRYTTAKNYDDDGKLTGEIGSANLSLIHISEPTRLRRISYAVFCLKKKTDFFAAIRSVSYTHLTLPTTERV